MTDAATAASGELTIGFIPLVDAAALIVAHEKGFAKGEGLRLTLTRETSWANIRDRVALGHFDAAHMLGPMPIASSLGLGRARVPMVAPFALGLGGNAITLSTELFAETENAAPANIAAFDPRTLGLGLAAALRRRRATGREPPTLAVVHPFSAHNYELRYWLAASGIAPDEDVRLTVVPPQATVQALSEHQIDGFCAGEPWNSLAVAAGVGVMAVTKSALWRQAPDKVLGLRADFATQHGGPTAALLRALYRAAEWAGAAANHSELAAILAQEHYLHAPAATLLQALAGRFVRRLGSAAQPVPDFLVLDRYAATFPWLSHALWFYSQMVRWGHVTHSPANVDAARGTYRPDIYRAALAPIGVDLPRASAKVEGALQQPTPVASRSGRLVLGPDGFFDGHPFDPDHLDQYIASFDRQPHEPAE